MMLRISFPMPAIDVLMTGSDGLKLWGAKMHLLGKNEAYGIEKIESLASRLKVVIRQLLTGNSESWMHVLNWFLCILNCSHGM